MSGMKPITREEVYLNKLAGEDQTTPEPVTREEQYLSRLCGADNIIPQKPETRRETYLAALCGEEVETPEPVTRIEQYMNFAAGKSQSKPEKAITREEMYWDKYQGGAVPEEKTVGPASSITVTDAVADKAKSLIVSFEPTQQGTPTATDYGKVYRQTTSPSGNMLSIDKLVGGTVCFNQMIRNGDFSDGTNYWNPGSTGVTISASNNILTVERTSGSSSIGATQKGNCLANHVYLCTAEAKKVSGDSFQMRYMGLTSYTTINSETWMGANQIIKARESGTDINLVYIRYSGSNKGIANVRNVKIHDLTQMFGSTIADYVYSLETATEGAGVAWLKNHGFIDDSYHAYNTGELMSVKASAHVIKNAGAEVTNTYNLDSNLELRGMPKLDANNVLYYDGDEYAPSGEVTRKYGIVDMGTLDWNYNNSAFRTQANYIKPISSSAVAFNGICAKYQIVPSSTGNEDKTMQLTTGSVLRVYDSSYTDAATFKTAMSGVYLVYKLATATTEVSTAYIANETLSGGTQEFTDSRAVKIPVGVVGKARQTYGFYLSTNARITINGADKYFTYNRAGSHGIPYYGITFDAINGGGTDDWAVIQSYNGETLTGKWLSNMDVYAEGTTPTIGAQVLYKTDNPSSVITYGPPIEVDMQEGTNTISAVANIYIGSGTEPATVTLTYLAKAAQRVLAMNRTLQKNLNAIEQKKGGDVK